MFEGKIAIVTGAGRGIGAATATRLSELGARLVVNDLDEAALARTADSLAGEHVRHVGDVTRCAEEIVALAGETWGGLDILVNNAGYAIDKPVHTTTDDGFQRMLDVHLIAPFRLVRAAAPLMREPAKRERASGVERFRKIVNVSSTSGTMGNATQASYASGKAGLVGLTKTLAKEWGPLRVNANAVAPAWIDTRMLAARTPDNVVVLDGQSYQMGVPAAVVDQAASVIPLGRPGTPDEAAGAVLFLCSPWSDFVNGQVVTVSGGAVGGMSA